MTPFNLERTIAVLRKYSETPQESRPRIAVFGDYCLDKYLYIDAALDEPSVETGLTAFQVREKRTFAGVAGTITANLRSLGANVFCLGVYGNDGEGFELTNALKRLGAVIDGMIGSDEIFTNTYTKPIRRENGVSRELNRLDVRNSKAVPRDLVRRMQTRIAETVENVDAVIISDQFPPNNGSIITDETKSFLADLARRYPNVFFFGDSRERIEDYREIVVKGNAGEILTAYRRMQNPTRSESDSQISGVLFQSDDPNRRLDDLKTAGIALSKRNGKPVLATRGDQGSLVIDGDSVVAIPAIPVEPPIDICGAGDATNAGFVLGRLLGLSLPESALLAAVVSSITIKRIGVTGTASIAEILEKLNESSDLIRI